MRCILTLALVLATGCGDAVVDDAATLTPDAIVTAPDSTTTPSDTTATDLTDPADPTTTTPPGIDFGPHYVLLDDPAPAFDGEVVSATVAYSGGCAVHAFPVQGRADSLGGATIWFVHEIENGQDDCEAYLSQAVLQMLPEALASLRPLRLIGPDSLSGTYVLAE